jgi:GNAT superfamily N-acetyltransferase
VGGPDRTVRHAKVEDIEDLAAIDPLSLGGNLERADELRRHVSNGNCWVSSTGDGVDGYAVLIPQHFFGRDFLELLVVARSARRSGIGTDLLGKVLALEGTHQVFTSTNRSNGPMRELLAKEGWQSSGELHGLDDDDPELVFFTWRT